MSTPRNAEYTKLYNKKTFLRLLRSVPLSRAEIARRMGLTRAATSLIAEELIREGLVVESESASMTKSGRPPIALSVARDAAFALGVYLNRDGYSLGVVSLSGEVVASARFRLAEEGKTDVLLEHLERLLAASGVRRERVMGVGISAPGPLDMEHGRILNPPRFSLWHNTDIAEIVAEGLSLPVYLENNAASLARYYLDKPEAGASENLLLLLVDSGIGSGIILNGKPFYGGAYFTGELGHTSIAFDGKPCACGNRGCLETYAAMPNLLAGTRFSSWADVMNERLIAADAKEVFEKEMTYLSAGVVNLVNLLAIDTVLLAGDLCYEGAVSAASLSERVNACVLRRGRSPIKVFTARTDESIKPRASADIVFERYLRV